MCVYIFCDNVYVTYECVYFARKECTIHVCANHILQVLCYKQEFFHIGRFPIVYFLFVSYILGQLLYRTVANCWIHSPVLYLDTCGIGILYTSTVTNA